MLLNAFKLKIYHHLSKFDSEVGKIKTSAKTIMSTVFSCGDVCTFLSELLTVTRLATSSVKHHQPADDSAT